MNSVIENVVKELGQQMQFQHLQLNENGCIHLAFNKSGDLYIEVTPKDELRFSLKRQHPYSSYRRYLKALELCHYSQPTQAHHLYRVGLIGGDTFFFSVTLGNSDLIVSEVVNVIKTLIRFQDILAQTS